MAAEEVDLLVEAAAGHRKQGIPVGASVLTQLDRWAAILGVEPLPR